METSSQPTPDVAAAQLGAHVYAEALVLGGGPTGTSYDAAETALTTALVLRQGAVGVIRGAALQASVRLAAGMISEGLGAEAAMLSGLVDYRMRVAAARASADCGSADPFACAGEPRSVCSWCRSVIREGCSRHVSHGRCTDREACEATQRERTESVA